MNRRILLVFILVFVLSACFDRYYIDGSDGTEPILVIEGTLTNLDGEQEIIVSRSSSPERPIFDAVSNCSVVVEDDQGNKFHFIEDDIQPGHYKGIVDDYYIVIGSKYRVLVKTPDGKEYASVYETMNPCPLIDSVYYRIRTLETEDPKVDRQGIEFLVDLKVDDTYGDYFRWELEETYEYHSFFPLTKYIDEKGELHDNPPDYTYYYCYNTKPLDGIYVLSVKDFIVRQYDGFALNFVENDASQRLYHHYSLLVKQYSLSESAFNFWNSLKKNNIDKEDIFGIQPSIVKSNIYNVNDSTEVVLGFFGVSAVNKKRVHVYKVPGFRTNHYAQCLESPGKFPAPEDMSPIYYAQGEDEDLKIFWGWTYSSCIFCDMHGGTLVKPEFWDEQ